MTLLEHFLTEFLTRMLPVFLHMGFVLVFFFFFFPFLNRSLPFALHPLFLCHSGNWFCKPLKIDCPLSLELPGMREHNILVLILHSCQEVWAPDLSEVLELLMFSFLLVCKDSSQVLECPWKSLHSEGCFDVGFLLLLLGFFWLVRWFFFFFSYGICGPCHP